MHYISRARIHIETWSIYRILMGVFTFTKEVHYTHALFKFLLSYTSVTWLIHYRTQKPILSWFETRRKTQATVFRCLSSQSFLPMGNKSHSAPISIFMAKSDECACKYKEILYPGWFFTVKVHNISSCIEYRYYKQVQFIKRKKCLASVLYKINTSIFQNLMMCLACISHLIHTDDALHFYQKSSLVLMICLMCTAYPCSYITYSI